jgi:hypothetical protein
VTGLAESALWLAACPYCEAAPSVSSRSPVEYALAAVAAVVVGLAVRHAIKCLIHPGEQAASHIKSTILDDSVVCEREDAT